MLVRDLVIKKVTGCFVLYIQRNEIAKVVYKTQTFLQIVFVNTSTTVPVLHMQPFKVFMSKRTFDYERELF